MVAGAEVMVPVQQTITVLDVPGCSDVVGYSLFCLFCCLFLRFQDGYSLYNRFYLFHAMTSSVLFIQD